MADNRDSNVSVAVRLRPFNDNEKARGSKCCIIIDPNKSNVCRLVNPSDPSISRQFTFDHIFNSFSEDPSITATQKTVWEAVGRPIVEAAWDGYNSTIFAYGQTGSGKSHTMVGFDHTDKGIIPNACEQIFQMIKNNDKDITFRVECSMLEIYNERIRDLLVPFSRSEKLKEGLKLRESPSLGVVVEGLKSSPVSSYEQIEHLMAEGTRNRTIAATNMNATSSRAHTCFMVKITQTRIVKDMHGEVIRINSLSSKEVKVTERTSIINLVDLAGSERQKRSGAAGDRLKEAGAINRSLSALGNVISALASNNKASSSTMTSTTKEKKHVPYRDSTLTFLLRDSLGGNARTTMLAACSPADNNFDETFGTLRYAERAKSIKNRPIINEGIDEKLVRELKTEVEELRKELAQAKKSTFSKDTEEVEGGGRRRRNDDEFLETEKIMMRKAVEKELKELEYKIRCEYEEKFQALGIEKGLSKNTFLNNSSSNISKENDSQVMIDSAWEARQAETDALINERSSEIRNRNDIKEEPHFSNLNEDPALSNVLTFPIKEGLNILGSSHQYDHQQNTNDGDNDDDDDDDAVNEKNMIVLGGIGIGKYHAEVYRNGETLVLMSLPGYRTCVNGQEVIPTKRKEQDEADDNEASESDRDEESKGVILNNDDCVAIGSTCIIRVRIPLFDSIDPLNSNRRIPKVIDWSTAVSQMNSDMIKAMHHSNENEMKQDRKFLNEKDKMLAKVKELEDLLAVERRKHNKVKGDSNNGHVSELEARLAAQVEATRKLAAQHEQELMGRTVLDEQLLRMLPLVHEANAISGELGKGLRFAVKLISKTVDINRDTSSNIYDTSSSHQFGMSGFMDTNDGNSSIDSSNQNQNQSSNLSVMGVKGKLTTEVAVLVHHDDDSSRDAVMWSANKFHDRIYLMREVYQLWIEGGESFENNLSYSTSIFSTPSGDPFYDPPEDNLVGVAYLQLEAVRWLLDMNEVTPLVDYKGHKQGDIMAELVPILINTSTTTPIQQQQQNEDNSNSKTTCLENQIVSEEYEDLADVPSITTSLDIAVTLHSAQALARKFITPSRSCYVSFRFPRKYLRSSSDGGCNTDDKGLISMRSPRVPLTTNAPTIHHTELLHLNISKELIEYLTSSAISFELWVSVDPPGPWSESENDTFLKKEGNKKLRRGNNGDNNEGDDNDNDDDNDSFGDSDSDDEGIPPHGIAVVRNQGLGQRKREREWQLQRQENSQQQQPSSSSSVMSPHLNIREEQQQRQQSLENENTNEHIPIEDYNRLQSKVITLEEENKSLKEQLEHAMNLIASQGPPLPIMNMEPSPMIMKKTNSRKVYPSEGEEIEKKEEETSSSTKNVVITGKSTRSAAQGGVRQQQQQQHTLLADDGGEDQTGKVVSKKDRLEEAKSLDRNINGNPPR